MDLTCLDCKEGFVHSEAEQMFFAQTYDGLQPSRCEDCRKAKRERNMGYSGDGNNVCFAYQNGDCRYGDISIIEARHRFVGRIVSRSCHGASNCLDLPCLQVYSCRPKKKKKRLALSLSLDTRNLRDFVALTV